MKLPVIILNFFFGWKTTIFTETIKKSKIIYEPFSGTVSGQLVILTRIWLSKNSVCGLESVWSTNNSFDNINI